MKNGFVFSFKILPLSVLLLIFPLGLLGAQAAERVPPKTLILATSSDPKTFNVLVAQETSSTEIAGFIFQGLTRYNPVSGESEPLLAERWEVSGDGLTWTFFLRRDIRWSDGNPFTAQDVRFTFEDIIFNPAFVIPSRDILTLQGLPLKVRVLNDYTVAFQLPEPFAPFLIAMSQPIVPQHILEKSVTSGRFMSAWGTAESPDHVTGTGPFRLHSYIPGERIELERNPYYWKTDADGRKLPYLDRIILLILPSAETRLIKFLQGETHVYAMTGQDYPILKEREAKGDFEIIKSGPGFGSNFVVFNQGSRDLVKRAWFQKEGFRRAAAYAMDRSSMIDIVLNGLGVMQCSPISPSDPSFYHRPAFCPEYDPDKARSLLAEEGFKDRNGDGVLEDSQGHPVEFVMLTNADNPERVQLAQMIREDWSRLGMKVHLLTLDFNTLVARLVVQRDWDAVVIGLTGSPDPHFGSNVWKTGGSLHFWEDPQAPPSPSQRRVDEIYGVASGLMDRSARKKLYEEWQEIAARELPHLYTVLPEVMFALHRNVLHPEVSAMEGPLFEIDRVDLREGVR